MRFAPEAGLMRVSWDSLFGNLFRGCPSPSGRGCAKRRVRAGNAPSSGPSGHLLPEGEGHEPPFRLIWTPLLVTTKVTKDFGSNFFVSFVPFVVKSKAFKPNLSLSRSAL